MISHKFLVSGRVQGVYYRANVAKRAKAAGFSGYVKNLEDGRVEACVSCQESDLVVFKKILEKGSTLSKVTNIEELVCTEVFSASFEVRK
jgi:acylphosphatase